MAPRQPGDPPRTRPTRRRSGGVSLTDRDRYRQLFLEEATEHLAAITDGLLRLEQGYDGKEIERLFRAAHSMKGMAATLGYDAEADLAHAIEDHLSHMRDSGDAPGEAVALLVEAADALNAAVTAVAGNHTGPDLATVTERVRDAATPADDATTRRHTDDNVPDVIRAAARDLDADKRTALRILLRADCAAPKARLMVLTRTLRGAGTVVAIDPPEDEWSRLSAKDGIRLHALVTGVANPDALLATITRVPDVETARIIDPTAAPPATPAPDARPAPAETPEPAAHTHTVRVPVQRIDRLLDRAGEVRIALSQLDRLLADHFLGERPYALTEAMVRLEREAKDLHDDALALRTLPVSVITRRFTRLVRDTAQQLDKQVRLVIEGEDTEVDRSVLEALADPVMHLVKNAIGHGVETPEERTAAGKDPTATVAIRFQRSPIGVEISVSDDGAGIDRDKVVARAIEAGHLEPGTDPASLSEDRVARLLTRPGFSTASTVTNVSGRGVGLDVVQDRLNAIGGSLRLRSTRGAGTTAHLTLPPTLAIVEALECLVDGDPYYIPIDSIVTTVHLDDDKHGDTVTYRDTQAEELEHPATAPTDGTDIDLGSESPHEVHRTVRLVSLDRVLGVRRRRIAYATHPTTPTAARATSPAAEAAPAPGRYGVIVEKHGHRLCLAVDVFGTIDEVVVKAVDLPGGGPRYVSGAVIRSDGRVGLLVDVPSLLGAGLQDAATMPTTP